MDLSQLQELALQCESLDALAYVLAYIGWRSGSPTRELRQCWAWVRRTRGGLRGVLEHLDRDGPLVPVWGPSPTIYSPLDYGPVHEVLSYDADRVLGFVGDSLQVVRRDPEAEARRGAWAWLRDYGEALHGTHPQWERTEVDPEADWSRGGLGGRLRYSTTELVVREVREAGEVVEVGRVWRHYTYEVHSRRDEAGVLHHTLVEPEPA